MRLLQTFVLVLWSLFFSSAYDSPYNRISVKSKRKDLVTGHEFSEVTRGGLLKILATFEEDINARLRGKKLYPLFTAQFGNNKFTKPYIYPKVMHTVRRHKDD